MSENERGGVSADWAREALGAEPGLLLALCAAVAAKCRRPRADVKQ